MWDLQVPIPQDNQSVRQRNWDDDYQQTLKAVYNIRKLEQDWRTGQIGEMSSSYLSERELPNQNRPRPPVLNQTHRYLSFSITRQNRICKWRVFNQRWKIEVRNSN